MGGRESSLGLGDKALKEITASGTEFMRVNESGMGKRAGIGMSCFSCLDVVEDMWRAVLGYVIEIGGLLGDLVGLKDVVDRMSDKASVLPPPFFSSPSPLS